MEKTDIVYVYIYIKVGKPKNYYVWCLLKKKKIIINKKARGATLHWYIRVKRISRQYLPKMF